MSTEILRPVGVGDLTGLSAPFHDTFVDNWEFVQEESPDEDDSYTYRDVGTYAEDTYELADHVDTYTTVNSVTVWARCRKTASSTNNQVAPLLRLSGITTTGSNFSITTSWADYSATLSKPGGGSWAVADINNLQAGTRQRARGVGGEQSRTTQVWIVVDYTFTPPNHPQATGLQCERTTSPFASEDPIFSAVFNGYGDTGTATHAYIQVSTVIDFSSTVWDSGWIDIADVSHGSRCAEISYSGSELSSYQPSGHYFWRIKFKDASAVESTYSDAAQFSGVNRDWWDQSYAFRKKLLFDPSHPELPSDTTMRFNFQTGNRVKIATNACFNEGIQEPGHMIAEYGGKTHVIYLSQTGSGGNYRIYTQTLTQSTNTWGTPVEVADSHTYFDTHYSPVLCIDNNGYIHIFYGCHDSPCYYKRSASPNDTSSWTTEASIGTDCSYPQAFVVPSTNRLVLIVRESDEKQIGMYYSDNAGTTWSSSKTIIDNTGGNGYRTYCYGCRFDKTLERLHLGFSFIVDSPLNLTSGVWYAYSTYNSGVAEGFSSWKTIDGATCGTIETSPITPATAGAVRINDTGDINIYFCRNVALTNSGTPLVFWATAPWYLDAWGQEAAFGMSKWNGSSWVHSNITENYDVKMRSDRSGLPTLCDIDGVIHTFTSVDSLLEKTHIPTSTGYYSDVNISGAATTYEAVDDGISFYDADATFVGKTVASGAASFFSNKTIPSGVAILSVGIECVIAAINDIWYESVFVPFLRISGVNYNGSNITGLSELGYVTRKAWWATNPATSGVWTKADAEAVEFGIKETGGTTSWRCTRINKLVKIRHSSDDEYYASEVVELTSSDDGDTWSIKRLTDNSSIGVPMLNIKHHFTNRRIELVWCAGNDLFYLNDQPYGKIRRDAKDLRIVWQGNDSYTELHRLIDYANYSNTLIEFKLPETITSGVTAGSKDLYIYYGNPNVATDPLCDPNIVYPLYFENFETLTANTNINGQLGWTVQSGTGLIYSSPPEHNNKVYAGANSLETQNAVFKAYQTFSPALTGVLAECSLWMENGTRLYLQAENSVSGVFSAGINANTAYAFYEDGTGFHDHATIRASSPTMNYVQIAVSLSGCSAWINNQQICNLITGINSITKLKLVTDRDSYFDMVKISRWWPTMPTLVQQAEEVIGFSTDLALLGAGAEQFYTNMKLLNYFVVSPTSVKLDQRYSLENEEKIIDEYNLKLNVNNKIPTQFQLGVSVAIKECIENLLSASSQLKIPIEILNGLIRNLKISSDYGSIIASFCKLIHDYLSGVTIYNKIYLDDLLSIEENFKLCHEYMEIIQNDRKIPIDSNLFVSSYIKIIIGYINSLKNDSCIIPSWLISIANDYNINIDNLTNIILVDNKYSLDYQLSTARLIKLPEDNLVSLSTDGLVKFEWLGELACDSCLNSDSLILQNLYNKIYAECLGIINSDSRVVPSWLLQIISDFDINVENISSYLYTGHKNNVEFGLASLSEIKVPNDNISIKDCMYKIPSEWVGEIAINFDKKIPVSYLGTLQVDNKIVNEFLNSQNIDNNVIVSYNGIISADSSFVIDNLLDTMSYKKCNVDWLYSSLYDLKLLAEFCLSSISNNKINTGNLITIDSLNNIPIENLGTAVITIDNKIPVDFRINIDKDLNIKIEQLLVSSRANQFNIYNLCNRELLTNISLDVLCALIPNIKINSDNILNISYDCKTNEDFLQELKSNYIFPIDYTAEGIYMIAGVKIPASWLSSLLSDNVLNIDFTSEVSSISSSSNVLIDYGQSVSSVVKMYPEFQLAVKAFANIVNDWCSSIDAKAKISISPISDVDRSIELNIEFGTGVIAKSKVQLESLFKIIKDSNIEITTIAGALLPLFFKNIAFLIPGISNFFIEVPKIRDILLESVEPIVRITSSETTNELFASQEAENITISGQSI